MRKRNLLVMAVLVVAISLAIAVPSSACTQGCTPGYWKQEQHFDSWVGFDPYEDTFSGVFGVGPDITLLEALSAKRQDFESGDQAALVRHAVAALLNGAAGLDQWTVARVIEKVQDAWGDPDQTSLQHREFEWANELGCPLN